MADKKLAHYHNLVTKEVSEHSLRGLEVDNLGLDEIDKRILRTIIEKYDSGACRGQLACGASARNQKLLKNVRAVPDPGRFYREDTARERSNDDKHINILG